jgi:hypothetical protein
MATQGHDRYREQQREEDSRYGLERDEHADFLLELELADRIAEQASLPPSQRHPGCAAARQRLGRGRSPYEQPHQPEPRQFAAGEPVSHHNPDGDVRPGRVVRADTTDGLVEVDFGPHGTSLVDPERLEPEAA